MHRNLATLGGQQSQVDAADAAQVNRGAALEAWPLERQVSLIRRSVVLRELGSWWAERMLAFIPENLRQRRRDLMDALVLELEASADTDVASFTISQRRRGRERRIGYFEPALPGGADAALARAQRRLRTVALRVPAALLLRQQVEVPLAAERDLDNVLRYRMDLFTPFLPDALFWSWRIDNRDRARGLLQVTVCLIPRTSLEPGFTALARAGISPSRLEVGQIGEVCEVMDLPLTIARVTARRRETTLAVALCGTLAVAALLLPFILQAIQTDAVDAAIAELKPRVAQASALRQRVGGNAASANTIAAEEARFGDILQALAMLTDILPDDTYLNRLTFQQRQVAISGRSAGAARLITALAAHRAIRNPAFAAPVIRTEGGNADTFSIRADLAP
jgi:general secretion pathway protein L